MPSYQDALSAHPSEFLTYATEMTAAATDLATQQTDYGTKVAEINSHWRDTANDAFNGEVGNVNAHLTQVIGEVTATASGLAGTAAQMLLECTGLKAADAALKALGFNIQPAPMVTLGPAQRTAIAMAGPFGGILEAALQAQAAAGTFGLQTLTSLINAADATAGAALSQAAELLKPLEDKSGGGKDMESHKAAEDHSSSGTGGENEEESSEEEKKEEAEEKTEEEQQQEQEQQQQQDPGQPQDQQQPTMPETPSGMEDMAQPEMPELDNPWDASELEDPEDLSGGLASGGAGLGGGMGGGAGGLGSGLPAGGAPTGGGMGAATMVGAAAGGAAGGAASKTAGGGMMGGGGGRGAGGNQDNEVERESFLVEDPEEDVWGIGKDDDNNPYS
ncbi:WXG100 family type VII secretion target [Glycomyces sp. NPDC048151]|uniref:WXG100 family type VII secretion target n=1 Tax=Glycomyces sp. NPDC048151 TaxID=3364002 RepID=UPI0037111217